MPSLQPKHREGKMNAKKWILASLAVFVIYEACNFLIHSVILMGIYEATTNLWRQDMNSTMWIMYVGDFFKAFIFVYIFSKGIENKGWIEGLRYGFWIGLYVSIGMGFGTYSWSPIPFNLALQWFIYGVIQLMICGIVAALIYRPAKE